VASCTRKLGVPRPGVDYDAPQVWMGGWTRDQRSGRWELRRKGSYQGERGGARLRRRRRGGGGGAKPVADAAEECGHGVWVRVDGAARRKIGRRGNGDEAGGGTGKMGRRGERGREAAQGENCLAIVARHGWLAGAVESGKVEEHVAAGRKRPPSHSSRNAYRG
jgi:hypothetical protein